MGAAGVPELNLISFAERGALDCALAERVHGLLQQAIDERGEALLVVSGGTTPVGFFGVLAALPLDWSRVTITLADERWVPPEHPDSNEGLLRRQLLIGAAAGARFLPLYNGAARPEDAEVGIGARLDALGRFDAVILGMGGDGHTASLFPGSSTLAAGLAADGERSCLAVHPVGASHPRLSLSLPRLIDTRVLLLHITGAAKRAVLEQAFAENHPLVLPIAAFLHLRDLRPLVYWAP
jgi:6-phosphogluconolactonase